MLLHLIQLPEAFGQLSESLLARNTLFILCHAACGGRGGGMRSVRHRGTLWWRVACGGMRSAELVVITETKTNRKWRKNEKLISDARRVDGVGVSRI